MRILFLGDIVGKPGRKFVQQSLPGLIESRQLDFVVANAENAVNGSGLTADVHKQLTAAGVDLVTLGDHVFRRQEIVPALESEQNLVRPANLPPRAPGRGLAIVESRQGVPVAVGSLLGQVFMRPVDCPFRAVDQLLSQVPEEVCVRIIDFHAEATGEKQQMGRHLDGRVSALLGTHTHVATADERILPGGTAFQCDVGMCGPFESIIGRRIDRVLEHTLTGKHVKFDVATEDVRLNGTVLDVDEKSGQALDIERMEVRASESG